MKLTLDIPDEMAAQLKVEAADMGTDEETFVLKVLTTTLKRRANRKPEETEEEYRKSRMRSKLSHQSIGMYKGLTESDLADIVEKDVENWHAAKQAKAASKERARGRERQKLEAKLAR